MAVPGDIMSAPALWARFTSAADALGAEVLQGTEAEFGAWCRSATTVPLAATPGTLATWPWLADAGVVSLGAPGVQSAPNVVACAEFAVAETGSVALIDSNAERAACFLAERLWLLVPAQAIVPTLDVAVDRLAARARMGTPYATLVSGPSRTADIERTLTIGVHGPRALTIVVVEA